MSALATLSSVLLLSSLVLAQRTHRVAARDSLWSIARQHSVSVEALRSENRIEGNRIRVGQVLRLPLPAETTASSPSPPIDAVPPEETPRDGDDESESLEEVEDSSPSADAEPTAVPPAWVMHPPAPPELPVAETTRAAPRRAADLGGYGGWVTSAGIGRVLLPRANPVDANGEFQLVVHFHGREPFRRQWVSVMRDAVLLSVDIGISAASYADTFSSPDAFRRLLAGVEKDVAGRYGNTGVRAAHVTLSAWGSGYGAVGKILTQPLGEERVDAVVLLDGLHAPLSGNSSSVPALAPFLKLARHAARGGRLLFVSHSSLAPEGACSAAQAARYLTWRVGGEPLPGGRRDADPPGMLLTSSFSSGNFHVRGFAGTKQRDHIAHLELAGAVLRRYVRGAFRHVSTPGVGVED